MNLNKDISKLHIITDSLEVIEQACQAGAEWIQLRMKSYSEKEMEEMAFTSWEICESYGAMLIINDFVELTKKVKAHGVHLGKSDLPIKQARSYLGHEFIIGGTANNQNDIKGIEEVADYIGLGPYRFTATKKNLSPIIGIEGYQKMFSQRPLIAIGGIQEEDIEEIIKTGVYGVAVSSAITKTENIQKATRNFLKKLNHAAISYC